MWRRAGPLSIVIPLFILNPQPAVNDLYRLADKFVSYNLFVIVLW